MQRLHEDDLVGHILGQEQWEILSFPAIAEKHEEHRSRRSWERDAFARRQGEALHPDREPLEVLDRIRRTIGEYNFAGQYQQSPAPLGGWSRRNGSNAIARTTGRCPAALEQTGIHPILISVHPTVGSLNAVLCLGNHS